MLNSDAPRLGLRLALFALLSAVLFAAPASRADDLQDATKFLKSGQHQQAGKPGDDHYDAKVKVLGEYIRHHVKEEQNEMFPKVRKTSLDLTALGQQMAQRKAQLEAQQKPGD